MLSWLARKLAGWGRPADDTPHVIYGMLAAHARDPLFYARYDIEDTLDGRFDTLILMVMLATRRLTAAGGEGQAIGQGVVDTMFADMDLSLHEIGVSENKVGKKVKHMATAYLGRMKAYGAALDAGDEAMLAEALGRNLYRGNGTDALANGLAGAVLAEDARLAGLDDDAVLNGAGFSLNLGGEGR